MMNGKDFKGSGRGLILRRYTGVRLKILKKTTKYSVRIAGLLAAI
jgi:hypothetical protein